MVIAKGLTALRYEKFQFVCDLSEEVIQKCGVYLAYINILEQSKALSTEFLYFLMV